MVTFILLMTLLIIGTAVGMMLRRAQRKKSYSPADREAESYSLTTRASEQLVDVEADTHYDRLEMHKDVTHGERATVLAPNYDRLGPHKDISEGERVDALAPHYDRLQPRKDVSDSKRADILEPYNDTIGPHEEIPLSERADAKGTGPQSGSYDPNRVYAEVDKSKKKNKNTDIDPSAATAKSVDIVEQHYECSDVFGQDWFGNEIGEKYEGKLGVQSCTPYTGIGLHSTQGVELSEAQNASSLSIEAPN